MEKIKPLAKPVHSSMRSSVIIYDFTRVVEELVYNSLDACAKKISVFVDVGGWSVKVIDNGSGITRDGLELLGERYVTSKLQLLTDKDPGTATFGFRGEALSSISDVSLLEIVTKTHGRPNGYRKVLKGCRCLHLGIDDSRHDIGTTVIVRDLFYNQPVRRKQIQCRFLFSLHSLETSNILKRLQFGKWFALAYHGLLLIDYIESPRKVLHSVEKCVLRVALVHPNVHFKVIDLESEKALLCSEPSSSPLPLLMRGFGTEISISLQKVYHSDGILQLSGFVSGPSDTFSPKALQYIYINSRYICKGPIHKMLNEWASRFTCSDIGADPPSKKKARFQAYPIYILNLICPRSSYDLNFEPSKTCVEFKGWAPVLTFVQRAIMPIWNRKAEGKGTPLENEDNLLPPRIQGNEDSNNHLWSEMDIDPSEDNSLHDDFGVKRSDNFVEDCLFGSALRDDPYSFVRSKNGGPYLSEVFHNCNEFSHNIDDSKDFGKAFLKGCSSKGRLFPDGLLYGADKKTKLSRGGFGTKRKLSSVVEGVDYFEDEHINQNSDLFSGVLYQKDSIRNHSSDVVGRKYDGEKHIKHRESDFLHSFSYDGDICSIDHFPPDELLYSIHEESQLCRDDFGTKRKLSSLTEGVYNLEAKQVYHNSDFFSGTLYRKDSKSKYSSDIVGGKYVSHGEVDFVGSFPYDGDIWSYADHVSSDIIAETERYENEHTVEPVCRITSWSNYHLSHKQRVDRRLKCDVDVNYDNYIDRKNTNVVFAIDGLPDCSQERRFPSFGLDLKDCFGQKRAACKYPCSDYRNDISSPRCSNISTANIKFSSYLDSSFKNCPNDYAGSSFSIPASKFTLNDKIQCESLRNQYDYIPPKEKLRRSCSAPPFYRGKRLFTVSRQMMMGAKNCRDLNEASPLDGTIMDRLPLNPSVKCSDAREEEHLQRYLDRHLHSQPTCVEDPIVDKRPDMKEATDADFERNEIKTSRNLGKLKDSALKNTNSCKEATEELIDSEIKWPRSSPSSADVRLCHLQDKDKQRDTDQCDILNISSGILHLVGNSLVPQSMNQKCLEDARVLQQVGKKFIPIVAKGILAVIDQHAADERIRLEELRAKVLSGQFKTTSYLESEQELVVPEIEYQLLQKYAEPIRTWGWICDVHSQASKSFSKNLNLLHRQPAAATILAVPCILGVKLSDVDLLEFLQQLADTDGSSTMPPAVLRVLNNKACRGAIMFGDALLPSECSLLVDELKKTALSFQCAHGRPTTVPLVNLESLHRQIAKLELLNECSNNSGHRLRRQKISMSRTAQRLKSARGNCQ